MRLKFHPQKQGKTLSVLSLLAACAVFGASVQAQTTVTFKASLASASCTPSIVGGDTVDMGTLMMSSFTASSPNSAPKTFTVNLTGCGTGNSGTKAKVYFWQAGAIDSMMVKTSGTGSGLRFYLLSANNNDQRLIIGTSPAPVNNSVDDGVILGSGSTATINYRVVAHRADTLTPGTINATANMVVYYP